MKISKSDYDKIRYNKIKNGCWKFNSIPPKFLTEFQKEILIGGLLGDSHLYQYKKQVNAGLTISHMASDEDYLFFKFNSLKEFCSSDLKRISRFDKRTNKTYHSVVFRTQVSPIFSEYRNKWYPKGIKIVPNDLKLTPLICSIWFCDDGCVTQYGKNKDRLRLQLSTDGFIYDEVIFLSELLSKTIGGTFNVFRKKKHWFIATSHLSTIKFIDYILPAFPDSMKRKSDKWKRCV